MPNNNPNMSGIKRFKAEKAKYKAKRLVKGRPKSREEKLMKAEEYMAYIDRFLTVEDDAIPNIEQTKIAVQMYDKVKKYEPTTTTVEVEDDTIAIILQKAEESDTE